MSTATETISDLLCDPARLLSPAEVSRILHKRPQSLAIDRMQRRGPRFCKLIGKVLYRAGDVSAFIEAGRVPMAAE